ncbi:hypothetical protein BX666DRAFT_2023136 [Dichotomocladium elegans]|nr:hypothetical protein BX666DRAFT_2023136 [Dichotomocladium elegans]
MSSIALISDTTALIGSLSNQPQFHRLHEIFQKFMGDVKESLEQHRYKNAEHRRKRPQDGKTNRME